MSISQTDDTCRRSRDRWETRRLAARPWGADHEHDTWTLPDGFLPSTKHPGAAGSSPRCGGSQRVRSAGVMGKIFFKTLRGLKGWGRRLERSAKEDRREIKSCFFFFPFAARGEGRPLLLARQRVQPGQTGAAGESFEIHSGPQFNDEQVTQLRSVARARVPHLSLLRHPYSRWLRRLLPHPPQNPGLTSPSSLQLPVLDLPLQCALMTFTSPLWAGATHIPHRSALRRTSNKTAMITRRIVYLSDSPVNCPSCLFCVLFCCLAGLSFIFTWAWALNTPQKSVYLTSMRLVLLCCWSFWYWGAQGHVLEWKKKSGWAGGQRPGNAL